MSPRFASLLEHLDRNGLVYQSDAERQIAAATFGCDTGAYQVLAKVDDDQLLQVFGSAPVVVPEGARNDVCRAITRANCGLKVGKFELDLDSGRLHFHIANVTDGERLSDQLVSRLIATTLAMLDRYMPAILSVIYGNENADAAIRRAEQ